MPYEGPGVYQHYKGNFYRVHGLALPEALTDKDSTKLFRTVTEVVYEPLSPGSLLEHREERFWTRALAVFDEFVNTEGGCVARFELVKQEEPHGA